MKYGWAPGEKLGPRQHEPNSNGLRVPIEIIRDPQWDEYDAEEHPDNTYFVAATGQDCPDHHSPFSTTRQGSFPFQVREGPSAARWDVVIAGRKPSTGPKEPIGLEGYEDFD